MKSRHGNDNDDDDTTVPVPPMEKVRQMIHACSVGDMTTIQDMVQQRAIFVAQQDLETGTSPLMAAAKVGNVALCQMLLEAGAPWNAIDRHGQCAGNYATDAEHWEVVNLLVEWGTRSELILGELQRCQRANAASLTSWNTSIPQDSSTKPNYLQHRLKYNDNGTALLDQDNDAVMMEWERPLMQAHAQILMEAGSRVLNVGFGMGIIDGILQDQFSPSLHIIIEAHPDVYQKMLADKWDQKPNVRICHGPWQEIMPQLIQQGVQVDGVFFDTYGEHSMDMEDFHGLMSQILSKPKGIYSFFNGLAPDNLFFHGVACQVVKLQLSKLGFDSEFLQCQIQVNDDKVWEGIRRKYWHNRDVYYLPRVTWNQEFLGRKTKAEADHTDMETESEGQMKRQRRMEE